MAHERLKGLLDGNPGKAIVKSVTRVLYAWADKVPAEYYNYKIPLRDIASKGKIKKSINEYLKDIKEITKAGRPKSRQAWYELAIKNNIHVDNGTI